MAVLQPTAFQIGVTICQCCNQPKVFLKAIDSEKGEESEVLMPAGIAAKLGADIVKAAASAQTLHCAVSQIRTDFELDDDGAQRMFIKIATKEGFTI